MSDQWMYNTLLWHWQKSGLQARGWTYWVSNELVYITASDGKSYFVGSAKFLANLSEQQFKDTAFTAVNLVQEREDRMILEETKKAAREAGAQYASFLLALGGERVLTMGSDMTMSECLFRAKLMGFGDGENLIAFLTGFNGILTNERNKQERFRIASGVSPRKKAQVDTSSNDEWCD